MTLISLTFTPAMFYTITPDNHVYHNNYDRKYKNQFNDHQHEIMMKDYYKHNQYKMTPEQMRELKIKTFP